MSSDMNPNQPLFFLYGGVCGGGNGSVGERVEKAFGVSGGNHGEEIGEVCR